MTASAPLRDHDIRWPLERWLEDLHINQPDTLILHEFRIPRPSSRADLATINGELAGFEIKSAADTFFRLARQVAAFNKVFDRITLVAAERHIAAAEAELPSWWGILRPELTRNSLSFFPVRRPVQNPERDLTSLLHLLHRPELVALIKLNRVGIQDIPSPKHKLIDRIQCDFEERRVRECTYILLKQRTRRNSIRHPHS